MRERIEFEFEGEIVESDELLNGTRLLSFSGGSADGAWSVEGSVSWNVGLVEFAGEGDITLARGEDEVYGSLARIDVGDASEGGEADFEADLEYEIDGGSGALDGANGRLRGRLVGRGIALSGRWWHEGRG